MTKRVHELFDPAAGATAPPAGTQLIYRGGPIMQGVQVVVVFWGYAWNDGANVATRIGIESFYREAVAAGSDFMTLLSQYDIADMHVGAGEVIASTVLTRACPPRLTDLEIQVMLQKAISHGRLPPQGPDVYYAVHLAPGTVVDGPAGIGESCVNFCGYHGWMPAWRIVYGVLPHPDCDGCLGGLSVLAAATGTASHELAESITDPEDGTGWVAADGEEIGDLCAWSFDAEQGITVQKLWSNAARACV